MTGEQLLIKTIKQCNAFEARVIELEIQIKPFICAAKKMVKFNHDKPPIIHHDDWMRLLRGDN